jgi:hypothetical protein
MSKKEIEELRSLVLSERGEKKGPFSGALRDRLNTFLRAKVREGESLQKVGAALGLSSHTVQYWKSRWSERDEGPAKLRRVKVLAERPVSGRKVTMHGPAGTRIEDLDLDEAAALWRKLS